jgi:predicted lactoylglutathione lyase
MAFRADDRAAVDAFSRAAIEAGGRDNGKPGLRPNDAPNCYAAFVYDPDGQNVEAVAYLAE